MSRARWQRRHYETVAAGLCTERAGASKIDQWIAKFRADNPRFRADLFRAAATCGGRRPRSHAKNPFKIPSLSFGLVKHSKRKMSARYYEREHTGKSQLARNLKVNVHVERGSTPTNVGRSHGFFASACFSGSFKRCGTVVFGRTPTVAAKKALVALGRERSIK